MKKFIDKVKSLPSRLSNRSIIIAIGLLVLLSIIVITAVASRKVEQPKKCYVTGCSQELCVSDTEYSMRKQYSICIWSEQYACYKLTKCELQQDNECGWTVTEEFTSCLKDKSATPN